MRRSSIVALTFAAILLCVFLIVWGSPGSRKAPAMTPDVARALLDEGRKRLERKDVDGMLALFARDATILKRSPAQIRPFIQDAMAELGEVPLSVKFGQLEVQQTGDVANIQVTMDVNQRFKNADASYFQPKVRLELKKEQVPRMLGLSWTEEWRIKRLESDETFGLPTR